MAEISVIIPTYNRVSFLVRSLASVQQQTVACGEIIVVDDGSTDDTAEHVHAFAQKCDIPVRYIYQENQGPAAARNRGICEAHYNYCAFLDSDDHWQKKKLELQYASLISRPEILISHTKERWFRRGVHLNQKKIHQPGDGDIFKHCLQLCAVGMSTVMVKKELFNEVGMFNENLPCCEDYDLWIRTSCRHQFLLIDTPLTIKEGGRDDQVSYQYRVGMDKFRIAAIMNLLRTCALSKKQALWTLEELQRKSGVYGKGCLKHSHTEEGNACLDLANWAQKHIENRKFDFSDIPELYAYKNKRINENVTNSVL